MEKHYILGTDLSYFDLLPPDLQHYESQFLRESIVKKELCNIDLTPTQWESIDKNEQNDKKKQKLLGIVASREGKTVSSIFLDNSRTASCSQFAGTNKLVIFHDQKSSLAKIVTLAYIVRDKKKSTLQNYHESKILGHAPAYWRSIPIKNYNKPPTASIERIDICTQPISDISNSEEKQFSKEIALSKEHQFRIKKIKIDANTCSISQEILYKNKRGHISTAGYDNDTKEVIVDGGSTDNKSGYLYSINEEGNIAKIPCEASQFTSDQQEKPFTFIKVLRNKNIITRQTNSILRLWQWNEDTKIYTIKPLHNNTSNAYINPEETQILSKSNITSLWEKYPLAFSVIDIASGNTKKLFTDKREDTHLSPICFLAKNKCCIGITERERINIYNKLEIWDSNDCQLIASMKIDNREFRCIDANHDNTLLALENCLWDIRGIAALDKNISLKKMIQLTGKIGEYQENNKGPLTNQDKIDLLAECLNN